MIRWPGVDESCARPDCFPTLALRAGLVVVEARTPIYPLFQSAPPKTA